MPPPFTARQFIADSWNTNTHHLYTAVPRMQSVWCVTVIFSWVHFWRAYRRYCYFYFRSENIIFFLLILVSFTEATETKLFVCYVLVLGKVG